jgi:hypothetical protein
VATRSAPPATFGSGLLTFSAVTVWVLDLPTGSGLCERCGALEKLWRTLFAIDHGSVLMAGDGLFLGTWIPLAVIGYALGARLAPTDQPRPAYKEEGPAKIFR